METIAVQLTREKETKNTWRYATSNPTVPISALYINKTGLPEAPPQAIVVTVVSA